MTPSDLAAIVAFESVDEALTVIADEDRYDDARRIERYDEAAVAIPILEPLEHPTIDRIERGVATEPRVRSLDDHLRAAGWSAAERRAIPRSYARIGRIIAFNEPVPIRPDEVATALLALHREARTVVEQVAIDGATRRPRMRHLGGESTTKTRHREHGIVYELDLAEVMISPGNHTERARMGALVDRDERVLDLCAGIGYFTLPMAVGGAHVTAIERNPVAFGFLSRNAVHNDVADRVRPICADCRTITSMADRVVIGHLPVHDCRRDPTQFGGGYLDAACRSLTSGGWLHVHGIARTNAHSAAADTLRDRLERRGMTIEHIAIDRVKGIAPRTDHVVLDVELTR